MSTPAASARRDPPVDPRSVRFSALVTTVVLALVLISGRGLVFAVVGTAGYLGGLTVLGVVAAAFALAGAFLNAALGFCLGCEMYALIARFRKTNQQGATA
jgi:hypothetical protein